MESVQLIMGLVAEGVGVVKEIADLARRAKAGEVITDAEIDAARVAVNAACQRWDAAADQDKA